MKSKKRVWIFTGFQVSRSPTLFVDIIIIKVTCRLKSSWAIQYYCNDNSHEKYSYHFQVLILLFHYAFLATVQIIVTSICVSRLNLIIWDISVHTRFDHKIIWIFKLYSYLVNSLCMLVTLPVMDVSIDASFIFDERWRT